MKAITLVAVALAISFPLVHILSPTVALAFWLVAIALLVIRLGHWLLWRARVRGKTAEPAGGAKGAQPWMIYARPEAVLWRYVVTDGKGEPMWPHSLTLRSARFKLEHWKAMDFEEGLGDITAPDHWSQHPVE